MKPKLPSPLAGFLSTSLILCAAASAAQPVPITNAGFENPALGDGGIQNGNVPGWSAVNGASIAVLDPSPSADLTAGAPEGENVGIVVSNSSENGLSQTLGSPLQADASYSLTVTVANTIFTSGFPGYGIQLVVNGTVLAEDNNSQSIAEDSVVTRTVNYTYNAGLHASLVGQPLEIRLLSKGLEFGEEVAFDDVRLSATLANPSANPGGPYSVDHGATLSLNGSGSLPSEGQTITTYAWDLDDDGDFDEGVTGATPAAINHATLIAAPPAGYGMELGPNTIRLRVTDSSAKTSTTEGTVTLLPPVSKFTPSIVRPTLNDADQQYFNDPLPSTAGSPGDKWFAEVSGAGQTKGQSFTITGDRILKGLTYRLGKTQAPPDKVYVIRINALDPATNTLYPIHTEEITQKDDWGVGNEDSYGTWSFGTPITLRGLPGGTVYGFDIAMKSSTSPWQSGIPYPTYMNSNVFAGGYKYTCAQTGTQGSATNTVQPDSSRDREFHADMETTTFVDTVTPALTSIDNQVGGGPIYQDQVQVTYLLTFDDAVDASTIDLADFENLGSGVTINSVVSATHTIPYPIASVVKVVLGVSGSGTLRLGVKSGASIADHAGNAISVPVADDTTITVNAGTNPGGGNRWWDGTVITGITDGASQGGTATWNTTTTNTNWDRGFGFAAPVAWNNSSLTTAIFGGTTGTVTLGTAITAGGITTAHASGTYTISGGNTLTFDASEGTPVVNVPAGTLAISSAIAGTKGLQKSGAGTLQLTGTNNISGGLTLTGGTLIVTNAANVFGTGTLTVSGGQIRASSNGQVSTTTNDHHWNGNFTLSRGGTGSATWNFNGNILLGANVSVSHSDNTITTTLGGNISDGGNNRVLTLAGNTGSITLSGTNTHGGGTTLTSGTLRINNASALGTGTFTIGGTSTFNNVTGAPLTLAHDNVQAWNGNFTFTGTHDLNLGNGPVNMNNNRTITVSASTLTIGGGIGQSGGNRSLTKDGAGTLVLSGSNTYAGNTTVNAGTLALTGGSQNSAITMNAGTFLTLTLGSPTTSTKALTLTAGSKVRIIGTPSGPTTTYPLFATAGITGTPEIETAIPGYDLVVINDDELRLVQTGSDLTPPTLTSIVDDKGGATVMTGTTVTYIVTLNEDMDHTSVSAADFGNAGTALVTIGSVIETSPGVFSVEATPTSGGTLQLQINMGAVLKDLAGINLVTAAALPDETIITVEALGYEDWATGGELFEDDSNGDGVDNGVAFLLGAADPFENAINRLPAATRDNFGNLVLTFSCLPDADRDNAALYVEHSRDLGGADPWAASAPVTDNAGGPAVNGVTLSVIPSFPLNSVTATIGASQADGTGKLYGRLRAVNP